MDNKNSLQNFLAQSAPASTTYVDIANVAEKAKKRRESEAAIAKEADYYRKVRELNGLRARGTSPAAMWQGANNLAGDLIGNSPKETMENAVLAAVPAQQILTKVAGPLARKGVGRVVTNVVNPFGYDFEEKLRSLVRSRRSIIKSIADDVPLWADETRHTPAEIMDRLRQRDTPYRMQFGLKPRYDAELYAKNADGSLRFNDASVEMAETTGKPAMSADVKPRAFATRTYDNPLIEHIRESVDSELSGKITRAQLSGEGDMMRRRDFIDRMMQDPAVNQSYKSVLQEEERAILESLDNPFRRKMGIANDLMSGDKPIILTEQNYHPVMGAYNSSINPAKRIIQYDDKWDFALNPGESVIPQNAEKEAWDKMNEAYAPPDGSFFGKHPYVRALFTDPNTRSESLQNLARYLMDKITLPVEIKGAIRY
jgi:hypothetical protein